MSRIASVLVVVVLIVAVNVGLRLIDGPSVNVSLPDIDVPDWLQWANKIKNVLLLGLLVAVVIGGVLKDRQRRDR
ncbi:hypothetical protein OJ997_19640 [Solirubrobacter phytolaccae]|uniref:Uncharacterized protein n=1 Tax=Solirubrobacter phytolaccae TaxID=1404360 RepID=A0A9X3NJJ6_9ACTN|nr:hypothetical protein [Solirubrobacter phytolaccae]MDA0182532.1 hypothetical protein [Solirubrobacter phytolaccae]